MEKIYLDSNKDNVDMNILVYLSQTRPDSKIEEKLKKSNVLVFEPYPGKWISLKQWKNINDFIAKGYPCYEWDDGELDLKELNYESAQSRVLDAREEIYYQSIYTEYPLVRDLIVQNSEMFNMEVINGHSIFSWLRSNWILWKEFEKRALEISSKKERYSARIIVDSIRFDTDVRDEISHYKIDNNRSTAELSRLFLLKYPDLQIFELRKSTKRCA